MTLLNLIDNITADIKNRKVVVEVKDIQPYILGMEYVLDKIKEEYSESLVVIPQFVADWLEKCKLESDKHSLSSALGNDVPYEVSNWLSFDDCRNEEIFARAWIEGYEVEKEKLYWVRGNSGRSLLHKSPNGIIYDSDGYGIDYQERYRDNYTFTEKEIKDYDGRYWAFAVPVDGV